MINYETFWVCFFRWYSRCPNHLQIFKHTSPKFLCSFLLLLERFMLLLTPLPWQIVPQPSHACVGHQNFMKPLWRLSISLGVVNVCNSHALTVVFALKYESFSSIYLLLILQALLQRVCWSSWKLKGWLSIMWKAICRYLCLTSFNFRLAFYWNTVWACICVCFYF